MASYATFLLTGNTLLCKSILVGTVKRYLTAVSELFLANSHWDPCITQGGSTAPILKSVYREAKRWESMPNRQEALTIDMIQYFISQSKSCHRDSPECAIADWCIMGLHSGFRCSEWCQPSSKKYLELSATVKVNIDGSPTAFLASDFILKDKKKRRLPFTSKLAHSKVVYCSTRWRFQRNGDNGQIITYSRNLVDPELCYISAILRILARAKRLKLKTNSPVAVATSTTKKCSKSFYITSSLVAAFFQNAAKIVHHVTSSNDLARFSSHSLRVGACVLLHMMKHSPDFIKLRLRWRSDTYKDYLRDVSQFAIEHSDAVKRAFAALASSQETP